MWSNLQFLANLDAFTEEILNGKLHFLCSERSKKEANSYKNLILKTSLKGCFQNQQNNTCLMVPNVIGIFIYRFGLPNSF